eukprot:TRINITY_DN9651_c0_g1_i18.p1 TRINITY_DN9651_c0_g1~~TRINITY_DN9651_c0_g1_i18.p1  ORF type:complete len:214 (+),score=0.84 TRINITY_DN9651_c0_g1_i18:786-1427(+)
MLNSSIGDLSSSLSTTLAGLTAQVAVTDLSLEQGVGELSMRLNSTRSTLLEQPVFSLMNFWRDGSLLYYIDCDKDRTQYILDAGDYTQEVRAGSGRHGFVYQPPTTGRGGRLIFSLANSVGIACILRSSEDDSPKPYHYRIVSRGSAFSLRIERLCMALHRLQTAEMATEGCGVKQWPLSSWSSAIPIHTKSSAYENDENITVRRRSIVRRLN